MKERGGDDGLGGKTNNYTVLHDRFVKKIIRSVGKCGTYIDFRPRKTWKLAWYQNEGVPCTTTVTVMTVSISIKNICIYVLLWFVGGWVKRKTITVAAK